MNPKLTDEQCNAVKQHYGLVEVDGVDGRDILMSMDVYRDLMGVGTDDAMAESLAAIERGLADINTGKTRPFRDVLNELGSGA